jgi:NADPH2:quinone reductase
MKAAVVFAAGQPPAYGEFRAPQPATGQQVVRVAAAALTHLTRGRAAGTHYSAEAAPPFVPGVDGVGTAEDGRRVYFLLPQPPFGALAELSLVPAAHLLPVPDGLDDAQAAALANPGMASWAALTERARLAPGETVLVNGATGAAGRLAVQLARHLGAARVVATGRNAQALEGLRRYGADRAIALAQEPAALAQACAAEFRQGVDVVLDFLWGPSAEALLAAAARATPEGRRVRYVQIGAMTGADITLPAAALRAAALELMGSGLGSVAPERLLAAIAGVFAWAAAAPDVALPLRAMPLADVAAAWARPESRERIVLRP